MVNDDDDDNANVDGIANGANQVIENNEEAEEGADQSVPAISLENSTDEFIQPDQTTEEEVCRTRSGRISKPYYFSRHFLETAHYQDAEEKVKWIKT